MGVAEKFSRNTLKPIQVNSIHLKPPKLKHTDAVEVLKQLSEISVKSTMPPVSQIFEDFPNLQFRKEIPVNSLRLVMEQKQIVSPV